MNKKEMKRLPESELEIMQIIWKETAPVSRITVEKCSSERSPSCAYYNPDSADTAL